ncbi:hypothetical protein BD410DRAFT_680055, partial [Rickenella mellea]
YKKAEESKSTNRATVYTFYCAQLSGENTKSKAKNERLRGKMTRYDCEGWLRVTVSDDMPDTVRVRIRHHSAHGKYTDIAIPDNIKELISQMSNSVPSQIWDRILQENPDTELTRKQIYAHW